ncbi:MAG: two-component sensor histidine kinase [Herbaspirillum sp.]|nr:two-component sensor histidine kinase [Herbaspirillum sp.]
MKFRRSWSLTARVTLLFALIACAVVTVLGIYLYASLKQSLEIRADYTLIARVERFRALVHDLHNVKQMEEKPALFESMMGNEQDVRIFRRKGEPPFILMNPANLKEPSMTPIPVGAPLGLGALHDGERKDGVRVRWISVLAQVGDNGGDTIEIIAAYVMTQEARMLSAYRWRVIAASVLAALFTSLLGFVVLRRGLLPLAAMVRRSAEITPVNLTVRLGENGAPPELRHLAQAFNAMLDRLENGYENLSQFSADLAHEIRTPVNVLMGQTQVALGQTRQPEEYEQLLESNLEELTRLSRIIENILFLAHADHAGLRVDRGPVALDAELQKIADYFEGMADERGMHFEVAAGGSICDANIDMWRRAVSNLVVNAVRYGNPGTTIRLSAAVDAQGATVSVANRGESIPRQKMERMFDRFYRGDRSRSAFTESNGLGLAIVKAIMILHGGSADVSCSGDGDIRFDLYFPAK